MEPEQPLAPEQLVDNPLSVHPMNIQEFETVVTQMQTLGGVEARS